MNRRGEHAYINADFMALCNFCLLGAVEARGSHNMTHCSVRNPEVVGSKPTGDMIEFCVFKQ